MSAESKRWQVGIVGVSPSGLFLVERMSLEPSIRLVGVFDQSPERRELAASSRFPAWDSLDSAISSAETDVLIFADQYAEEAVAQALHRGKHVVLDRPWQLSSESLRRLNETARKSHLLAAPACHQRWTSAFLAAFAAKERLGAIHTARYTSCEQSIPNDPSGGGVLREFGYHLLDQLLLLVTSSPLRMFARQFFDRELFIDHGLLLEIEFSNDCTALIDLQTQSRLSHRTGWMLEGSKASYRNGRIYETTSDGEFVDEPVATSKLPADPFLQELLFSLQGRASKLATLGDAANVVRLVELIEQSAMSNQLIRIE